MLSLAPNEKFLHFHLLVQYNAFPIAKIGKVQQNHNSFLPEVPFPPPFLPIPPFLFYHFQVYNTRVSAYPTPGSQYIQHPDVSTYDTRVS